MSLDAFFIGIIQVLVYAGAVMVLFLFIIMLLDFRAEERRTMNWVAFTGGFVVAFSLLVQILAVISRTQIRRNKPFRRLLLDHGRRSQRRIAFVRPLQPALSSYCRLDSGRDSRRYRFEQTPTPMTYPG